MNDVEAMKIAALYHANQLFGCTKVLAQMGVGTLMNGEVLEFVDATNSQGKEDPKENEVPVRDQEG